MTGWSLAFRVLPVLLACAGTEAFGADDTSGTIWRVTEIDGLPFSARATLTFPGAGRIAGQAPCNNYTAKMSAPFPAFRPGPIVATRMACPMIEDENRYFEALAAMTRTEVADDTLILSAPDGRSITLQAVD